MVQKKNLASSDGDPVAAVIGDVVGSRDHADRPDLHVRLVGRLAELEELLRAEERAVGASLVVSPPRVTVGDEYQGIFTTLGVALRATRWLRISLLPDVDVRHGLGWGPVQVLEDEPRSRTAPAGGRRARPWSRWRRPPCGRATVVGGRRTCASTAVRVRTRWP